MPRHAAAVLLAAVALPAAAADPPKDPDVFCLIHPKCCLDPADAEKGLTIQPGEIAAKVVYPVGYAGNQVPRKAVVGTGLKDVPRAGECFVVEFPETKLSTRPGSVVGVLDGERAPRRFPYDVVKIEQPYRLWYCKDAAAAPALLGEGTAFGTADPVRPAGDGKVTLLKGTPAELARAQMPDLHESIGKGMLNCYADKVFVAKPVPGTEQLTKRAGWRDTLPWPVFKPTRVTAEKDGSVVVEADVHSRLPVLARCTFYRAPTEAEQKAFAKAPQAVRDRWAAGTTADVNLEPGEKRTLRFVIPPTPNGLKFGNDSTFAVEAPMYKLYKP